MKAPCYAGLIFTVSGRKRISSFLSNLLYTRLASFYDLISFLVSKGKWFKWQKNTLSEFKGTQLLEVGCGTGRLLFEAERAGYTIYGLDKSMYMLRKCLRNIHQSKVILADSSLIPIKTSYIDCIVVSFPTDSILVDDFFEEAYRILKPEGRLIILDNPNFFNGYFDKLFNYLLNFSGEREIGDITERLKNRFRVVNKVIKDKTSSVNVIVADKN
ncbi:MAG: class I SAM-dependent methyltransferase [Gammaproteobacteria bacterium]